MSITALLASKLRNKCWLRTCRLISFQAYLLIAANLDADDTKYFPHCRLMAKIYMFLCIRRYAMEDYKFLFKVVLIGNAGVGKLNCYNLYE